MMLNCYYVYVYYDPRKLPHEPIYVGKGHGNRYRHHVSKGTSNKHFANKLKKIAEAGFEPIIEFVRKDMINEDAIELEIELIAKYGRADKNLGSLCNWTDGGEGTSGYQHSPRTKELFSKQRKGKKQTERQYKANCSRKQSDDARLRISEATKGHRRHTPEQIEAIKQHNKTKVTSDETRKKFSETRLGKTKTKATYPPLDDLLKMIDNNSMNKVAKKLGVCWCSLSKYLKRRGVKVKDARKKQ